VVCRLANLAGEFLLELVAVFDFSRFVEFFYSHEFHFLFFFSQLATFMTLLIGVAVGGGISVLLFAVSMHRVSCVKLQVSGLTLRSTMDRNIEQKDYLDRVGDQIQVLQLQGYIFFGNATGVVRYVQAMSKAIPSFAYMATNQCFLIIDLPFVLGLDASAVESVVAVYRFVPKKCEIIFSGGSASVSLSHSQKKERKRKKKLHPFFSLQSVSHGIERGSN
jgi:MFS superfamily sulfate permease-like transporter